MDYNSDCYLDKSKKYDKFIPETDIKRSNFKNSLTQHRLT